MFLYFFAQKLKSAPHSPTQPRTEIDVFEVCARAIGWGVGGGGRGAASISDQYVYV